MPQFELPSGQRVVTIEADETRPCPACRTLLKLAELMEEWGPPADIDAERATLGSMLVDAEAAGIAAETLNADDFCWPAHRLVFETICDIYDAGEQPDTLLVAARLDERRRLDEAGGKALLESLPGCAPSPINVAQYAEIVKSRALARQLVVACLDIAEQASSGADIREVLDDAERQIFDIASRRGAADIVSLKDSLQDEFEELLKRRETPGLMTGLPTGFTEINEFTGGWQRSDLILLAGGPSVGKSVFVHGLARHAALVETRPVLVFSPGMSRHNVTLRLLSSHCGLDYRKLRGGFISDEALNDIINHGMGPLRDAPIYIDDTQRISAMALRAKARRLKTHHDIALIIVDDLQLVTAPPERDTSPRHNSRGGERGESDGFYVARSLQHLARELNIPVIATVPVPPGTMANKLYAVGVPEQHADVIMLLHRDRTSDSGFERDARLTVAKQRNGPTGTVTLLYNWKELRFVPATRILGE